MVAAAARSDPEAYPSSKFRPGIRELLCRETSGSNRVQLDRKINRKRGANCLEFVYLRSIPHTITRPSHPSQTIPNQSRTHPTPISTTTHGFRFFETRRPSLKTKARHTSRRQQTQTTEASTAHIQQSCPRGATHRWHDQLTIRNR